MLPEDFQWQPHTQGDALRYLHHMIAFTARGERCCIAHVNPNLVERRQVMLANELIARHYIEAWAVKWEGRIRASYMPYAPIPPPPPYAGPEIRVVPESVRRRGGRRRSAPALS